jgi:hypothetical protein
MICIPTGNPLPCRESYKNDKQHGSVYHNMFTDYAELRRFLGFELPGFENEKALEPGEI